MAEVINWQEKYVSYVEGDLQKDIQELKDGQKALDAKIEAGLNRLDGKIERVEGSLRKDIRDLDVKVNRVEENLRKDIKDLDIKIEGVEKNLRNEISEVRKELGGKIDRILYIIAGAAAVAVIGGLVKLFIG